MDKKRFAGPLVIAAALALCGPVRGATELIQNGSFEVPELAAGTFQQLPTIQGWSGSAGIEVQADGALGAGFDTPFGDQYTELSVESASTFTQAVTTVPGEEYQLSFYLGVRPGTGGTSVSVAFDGQDAQVFSVDESDVPGGLNFEQFTLSVTATDEESVLSFTPTQSRGIGDLLDNVSLMSTSTGGGNGGPTPIPLPPGVWTGMGMLFALTAPRAIRRWRAAAAR